VHCGAKAGRCGISPCNNRRQKRDTLPWFNRKEAQCGYLNKGVLDGLNVVSLFLPAHYKGGLGISESLSSGIVCSQSTAYSPRSSRDALFSRWSDTAVNRRE
jgi:hypothetical protein